MNDTPKAYRKIVILTFPPDLSNRPILYHLARNYDLTFNILKAQITPRKEGFMTVEISGALENYKAGMEFIKQQGLKVSPAAQKVFRDEESCVQCGTCTAICPSDALHMDIPTRTVIFDRELCTACGLCLPVCPVRAMNAELEDVNW